MSSIYGNYVPSNAVDYNEDTDADGCRCCAGASNKPSWWRLDLGNQYPVKTIIFIGRSDGTYYNAVGICDIHDVFLQCFCIDATGVYTIEPFCQCLQGTRFLLSIESKK